MLENWDWFYVSFGAISPNLIYLAVVGFAVSVYKSSSSRKLRDSLLAFLSLLSFYGIGNSSDLMNAYYDEVRALMLLLTMWFVAYLNIKITARRYSYFLLCPPILATSVYVFNVFLTSGGRGLGLTRTWIA